MINEGIFGIQETITPVIQGDEVVVQRRLVRHNGSAAIPTGQSVEFEFYVAQFPFDVSIQDFGLTITTSERSSTPQMGVSDLPARPASLLSAVTAVAAGQVAPSAGTGLFGAVGPPFKSFSFSDGRPSASGAAGSPGGETKGARDLGAPTAGDGPGGGAPPGAIARMRGIDVNLFGDLLVGGTFDPPPPAPDPVIPFEVTLTPPNGLEQMIFTNPRASQLRHIPTDVALARVDPVFLDKGRGLWKINVRNINANARRLTVAVTSNHALAPLQRQILPLSLLNHLMGSVLKKSVPTVAFDDGRLFVQTPTHFLGLMGVDTEHSIGGAVASLIDSVPTFSPTTAALESRSALIARIIDRREALREEYDRKIAEIVGADQPAELRRNALRSRRNRAISACDASIQRLTALRPSQAVFCIVVEGMFSDAPISLDYVGTVARIDNKLPQIALVFDERMNLSEVVTNIAIDLSPALAKVVLGTAALVALSAAALSGIFVPLGIGLAIFGGYKLYNSIDDLEVEERIRLAIRAKGPVIGHYVKSAFERISAIGASALRCELIPNGAADGKDALRIFYYDPAAAVPPRPRPPHIDGVVGPMFDTVLIASGETQARPATAVTTGRPQARARAVEQRIRLAREAAGPLPEDFRVERPETLQLLDRHEAIVVLMMENRSFDHFFHDLADTFPGRGYSRVPPDFTNAAPPGFGAPLRVTRNVDIGIGHSLIFGRGTNVSSLDPHHNYEHTRFQIGGGTEDSLDTGEMNGFARDFAKVSDSPQIVMSYYGMDSLPVYRVLADHYPVCDNWFAALPVGTYPNRLSMLQGNVPFLHNIHADDPAIGYLEDYSIFDLLNMQGIPWKFFESDIGTIRLYDRFRLDVANVRPISDLEKTLQTGRDTGQLPRVMFVEPEFLFGNDDHPPMNIQDGQDFIRQVVGKFIDYGLLDRVMFLITYDEHGGFFDHVPPPGTARGPAEWLGQVAGLYPQDPALAPKSLGVRVPSLLLSKFASSNAKHQVLDHTAILKTILLHNRLQISTAQFSRFGERVKRCAHFGELLDLPVPRQLNYAAMAQAMGYRSDSSWFSLVQPTIVESRVARLSPGHPARVLRAIAQPRAKRLVGA